MLKSTFGTLALTLAMAFPAAAEVIPALHDALPQKYQENGIKIAVFNDWAPDVYVDENGDLAGWSVEIAHEMQDRLGVPFHFEGTAFDPIIPGLISGRFDAGFASFGTNAERLQTLDFISQRTLGTAFAYDSDADLDIVEPNDVCGLTVAVLNGAWDIQLLEKLNEETCADNPIVMQLHGTQAQAELAVRSNRAEVNVGSEAKLRYMAKQTGDLTVSDLVLDAVNSCIGVRKDDPLGQVMTDAIQTMIDDGTYQKIMAKWGLDDAGMLESALLITEENPDF